MCFFFIGEEREGVLLSFIKQEMESLLSISSFLKNTFI